MIPKNYDWICKIVSSKLDSKAGSGKLIKSLQICDRNRLEILISMLMWGLLVCYC